MATKMKLICHSKDNGEGSNESIGDFLDQGEGGRREELKPLNHEQLEGQHERLRNFFDPICDFLEDVDDFWDDLWEDDPVSPLILDLDGDGVEADTSVYFDHGGDGFMELTGWVGTDDGMLVWDRNNNGEIDDGSELFGEHYVLDAGEETAHQAANGFAALRDLDSNNDGVINSADANWDALQVLMWQDSDGDGTKDALGLVSLSSLDIASLGTVGAISDHVDDQGHEHRLVGSYTKADGSVATMTDVWLQTNQAATIYSKTHIPEHSEEILSLPEVQGSGRVYDLRDAIALDEVNSLTPPYYGSARTETRSLQELVEAFQQETDNAVRETLVEKILLRWAGAEGAVSVDYGNGSLNANPQQIAVIEAFRGYQWRADQVYRNPTVETTVIIENLYKQYFENLWVSLMLQTHLEPILSAITTTTDETSGEVSYDLSGIESLGGEDGTLHHHFLRAMDNLDLAEWLIDQIKSSAPSLTPVFNFYNLELIRGLIINGAEGNDQLYGHGDLVDNFDGNAGGNDTLYGYGGNDVYWLGRGTGHDVIDEGYRNAGDSDDVIRLKPGLGANDIRLVRDQNHLYVQLVDGDGVVTDSYRIHNYYTTDTSNRVERIETADGTQLYGEDQFALVRIHGTNGGEDLRGHNHLDDHFDGNAGGDDYLRGYGGNDVYWLGHGTGHDVIDEGYRNAGDSDDVIRLKPGLGADDIRLVRDQNHLYVQLVDGNGDVTDSYRINNYYTTDTSNRVERIETADGTQLYGEDQFALVRIHGTNGGEDLRGHNHLDDHFDGNAGGDDYLRGYGGNDVYWLGHGTGHDVIDEGYRNDGDSDDVIRLKPGLGADDIRLVRDQNHLYVQLVDGNGDVTDSYRIHNYYTTDASSRVERIETADGTQLYGEDQFALVRIHGTDRNEHLHGHSHLDDHFDGNAGGNDILYGYGGNDVYWLGRGTGHDVIDEGYRNAGDSDDVIRLKPGLGANDIRLVRDQDHLYVQLVDGDGVVTDSYRIHNYYTTDTSNRVERIETADGTQLYGEDQFALVRIHGTNGGEDLRGHNHLDDHFDGNAGGDDYLRGYGGNDVYWLGHGTGHDVIDEGYRNDGDSDDVIRLKPGLGADDIRLVRDQDHLYVQLVDGDGVVTDSYRIHNYYTTDASSRVERIETADGTQLYGEDQFALVRIHGTDRNEHLHGHSHLDDHFDGNAGGDDYLRGYGGNDVYWLGRGTGHDVIDEGYRNDGDSDDVIRLKPGLGADDIRLVRDQNHLYVQLVDGDGVVTDSYRIHNYYTTDASSRVERIETADGTQLYGEDQFALVRIHGTDRNEHLHGHSHLDDHFDGNAGGDDYLRGYGGNDVYWLGRGTGHDVIDEGYRNDGDSDDVIRLKPGLGADDIRLVRDQDHLYVQLVDGDGVVTDSYRIHNYYTTDASSRVERIETADGTQLYGEDQFALVRIHGTDRNEHLHGHSHLDDHFDGNAGGNDILYGYGGNDVYWLGRGTGHDVIDEGYRNDGDAEDLIKIEQEYGITNVKISRDGNHLVVRLNSDDGLVNSLRVKDHFTNAAARVELIEAEGRTFDTSRAEEYIDALREYANEEDSSEYETMQELIDDFWA